MSELTMLSRLIARTERLTFSAAPGHNRLMLVVRRHGMRDQTYVCSCEQGASTLIALAWRDHERMCEVAS